MPPRRRRARQPKVKVPKPAKIQRPKIKDLRMVLKGLLTVSIQNRIASLAYALSWYDAALPYLLQKQLMSADAKKKLEIAVKVRNQGAGTTFDPEKELSFRKAIEIYEKVCAKLSPPSVLDYYKKFDAKKHILEKKQNKLENKYGEVTELLQKAIDNRLKIEVADSNSMVQYNPALTSLSYNREAAKMMSEKFRKEGFLSVFLEQLPILARHASLEPSKDIGGQGTWEWSADKHVLVIEELLQSFVTFSRTADAPKKLVRFGVIKEATPKNGTGAPAQAGVKRAPRGSVKGPRLWGFIIPGTAIATVLQRLWDEQEHELTVVTEGLATGDPVGRVKQLGRYGVIKGYGAVSISNGKARLTLTDKGREELRNDGISKGLGFQG